MNGYPLRMGEFKQRVMVDFDGVLHSYTSGWTGENPTDPPVEGAQRFCQQLIDAGYEVVVFTTRAKTPGGRGYTQRYLRWHKFPEMDVTFEKLPACAYVDDRAVMCRPTENRQAFEDARLRIDGLAGRPVGILAK